MVKFLGRVLAEPWMSQVNLQGTLWVLVALVLVNAVPFSALAKTSPESIGYYEEAKDYLKKGDVKSAIIQLKNAIRADSNNIQARYDLAIIYLRGRDGPSAEKELKSARDRGMDENKIIEPLAQAYSLQSKYAELLEDIKPGDRPAKVNASILSARAGAYVALKKLDLAEKELHEAIKIAPQSPIVLLALSQVHKVQGRFAEAEAQIDKVLSADPENQRALLRKGSLQQARKDYDGAVESYSKALSLNEANLPVRVARATADIARGNVEDARADIDRALASSPNNPIARYLDALLLAREKKYVEAKDAMQPVANILANYPPALYLQASLSFAQGQIEQSQTQVKSYLAKVPNSVRGKTASVRHLSAQEDTGKGNRIA